MGVTGLLDFLKHKNQECSAIRPAHIRELKGLRAGIDAYSWLHKAVYTCAQELYFNKETNKYIDYCMKNIKALQFHHIVPVLVFDGSDMPFKTVNEVRRQRRHESRQKAIAFISAGNDKEAYKYMVQSIDVTHKMASNLIKACRTEGVECIVAPYEADSQLAYMEKEKLIDVVITEDSDLVVFGCKKIFFKWKNDGSGEIYDQDLLEKVLKSKGYRFEYSFDKFQLAAILSGCDYVASLHGIGLMKAWRFVNMSAITEVRKLLPKIPYYLKLHVKVTDDYINDVIMAIHAFKYPIIFDPISKVQKPAMKIEVETDDYKSYIGHFPASSLDELQLALGNIDRHNNVYDDFHIKNSPNNTIFSPRIETCFKLNATNLEPTAKKRKVSSKKSIPASKEEIPDDNELMELYASMPNKTVNVSNLSEEVPRGKPRKCRFLKNPSVSEMIGASRFFKVEITEEIQGEDDSDEVVTSSYEIEEESCTTTTTTDDITDYESEAATSGYTSTTEATDTDETVTTTVNTSTPGNVTDNDGNGTEVPENNKINYLPRPSLDHYPLVVNETPEEIIVYVNPSLENIIYSDYPEEAGNGRNDGDEISAQFSQGDNAMLKENVSPNRTSEGSNVDVDQPVDKRVKNISSSFRAKRKRAEQFKGQKNITDFFKRN